MRDERDGACSAAVVDASGSCGIDSTKAVCRCVGSYHLELWGYILYVVSVLMLPAGLGVAWSGCVCVVLFCFRLGGLHAHIHGPFSFHTFIGTRRWVGLMNLNTHLVGSRKSMMTFLALGPTIVMALNVPSSVGRKDVLRAAAAIGTLGVPSSVAAAPSSVAAAGGQSGTARLPTNEVVSVVEGISQKRLGSSGIIVSEVGLGTRKGGALQTSMRPTRPNVMPSWTGPFLRAEST